jgi:hypothetical protein
MALFSNFGVNRRNRLCGVHEYASALFLDILKLAENFPFLDRKLISAAADPAIGRIGATRAMEASGSLAVSRRATIVATD